MAASTWFQGSQWPPGNHGIMPSASCTAAIDSTVAATSARSRMPGTSGGGTSGLRLDGVDDQALADEGVEAALDQPHRAGAGGEVPDEEAVVDAGQRGVVVAYAHDALEPPVGRVEGVGVVGAGDGEPRPAQLGRQLPGAVDADVATLVGVVLVGERPADALRQPAGDGDGHRAPGAQDPGQLGQRSHVGGDVLEDLGGDDPVEGAVGEREGEGV